MMVDYSETRRLPRIKADSADQKNFSHGLLRMNTRSDFAITHEARDLLFVRASRMVDFWQTYRVVIQSEESAAAADESKAPYLDNCYLSTRVHA